MYSAPSGAAAPAASAAMVAAVAGPEARAGARVRLSIMPSLFASLSKGHTAHALQGTVPAAAAYPNCLHLCAPDSPLHTCTGAGAYPSAIRAPSYMLYSCVCLLLDTAPDATRAAGPCSLLPALCSSQKPCSGHTCSALRSTLAGATCRRLHWFSAMIPSRSGVCSIGAGYVSSRDGSGSKQTGKGMKVFPGQSRVRLKRVRLRPRSAPSSCPARTARWPPRGWP